MAVVESADRDDVGVKADSTSRNCDGGDGERPTSHSSEDLHAQQKPPPQQQQSSPGHLGVGRVVDQGFQHEGAGLHLDQSVSDAAFHAKEKNGAEPVLAAAGEAIAAVQQSNGGGGCGFGRSNGQAGRGEEFKRDMRDLEELLSKLNPMAEEFVPPPHVNHHGSVAAATAFGVGYPNGFFGFQNQAINEHGNMNGNCGRRKKNMFNQGKRINNRTTVAQREEIIRRTVYVSDIDQQVTEEELATLFINCGQVVDCRICGDPNSVLRFAFVEFTDEEGARAALSLAGTVLGYYPVRVLPSKTAIAPVNPTFLPRSEDEREMCARTIYCTNIDKRVTQTDVKLFFETVCGEVYRLRLLGDFHHATRIAFVEFVLAESAIAALNCSGVVLGTLPIRVGPSKTPVRPRQPRQTMH